MGKTRKLFTLTAAVAIFGLMLTSTALADNFLNDVTVGGTDTITAGGSTTISYRVSATGFGNDGQQGCNAADGSAATVAITVPTGVTASASSLTFTACNAGQNVTFSSASPGAHSITHSITDSGVGSYDNRADWTLNVNAAPPTDTTPPVITPTVTGTEGSNGWYTSDVGVSWTVVDNESTATPTNCGPVNITTDQAATSYTCSATSAGGTSSDTVTIKRDASAPNAPTSVVSPTPNSGGWTTADTTVTFSSAGDVGPSGVASCTAAVTVTDETDGQSVPGTCTDGAGNVSTETTRTVKLDRTAPTSSVEGITAGAVYGQAPAASCSASDSLSGVASHGTASSPTASGSQSITCNGATDNAGNVQTTASAPVGYTLAPMGQYNTNFDSTTNVLRVKPNQAIPLRWAFNDGTANHALLSGATLSSVSSTRCTVAGGSDGTEVATELAAGASGLQLLPDNSYQMNWKATSTTGCRALTITMTFAGGGSTSRTILVNIAK